MNYENNSSLQGHLSKSLCKYYLKYMLLWKVMSYNIENKISLTLRNENYIRGNICGTVNRIMRIFTRMLPPIFKISLYLENCSNRNKVYFQIAAVSSFHSSWHITLNFKPSLYLKSYCTFSYFICNYNIFTPF